MKRYLSILLMAVMLIVSFSGCSVKQTNETLTVWIDDPRDETDYKEILNRFQSAHPNVTLQFSEMPDPVYYKHGELDTFKQSIKEVEAFQNEVLPAHYEKLRADMIAGKGPDIMLFKPAVFQDIYKTMRAGAFCDLKPFLAADPDYKPEDYQQAVLSAGVMDDKQYVMPLFYQLPGGVTTEENIGENFDFSAQDCYYDVVGKLAGYLQKGGELPVAGEKTDSHFGVSDEQSSPLAQIGLTDTIRMDYEEQSITFDEPRFKQLQEWNKTLYYAPKAEGLDQWIGSTGDDSFPYFRTSLGIYQETQKRLYYPCVKMESCVTIASDEFAYLEQTPLIAPLRDTNGKIQATVVYGVAIRNNSESQQIAYDFLKLLMLPLMQFPVYKDSLTPIHMEMAKKKVDFFIETNARVQSPALPDSYYEQWKGWLNEIDGATFPTKLDDWILDYFEPYYKGEQSYEDCLRKAKSQLEIYVSE